MIRIHIRRTTLALWGNNDQANNTPISTPAGFNKAPTRANANSLYANTTANSFVNNMIVGVFGVDKNEINAANGALFSITVTNPGSGYSANATVTVSGNGTANATANSIGRISAVNITAAGNNYTSTPTVTIAASPAKTFNANTGVAANGFISIATNVLQVNDRVQYLVAAGNTAVVGLSNSSYYFVQAANTTGVYLATSSGGPAITLTPSAVSETGHSLTGQTATATATITGTRKGVQHTGWVIRREGRGGRAGRVHYETIATLNALNGDGDTTFLPNT